MAPAMLIKPAAGQKSPAAMAAAGRGMPRDIMWAKIRELRAFVLEDVAAPARLDPTSARHYANCLVAAGILSVHGGGKGQPARYELANDPGRRTPRVDVDGNPVQQGSARAAAWRAMRSLKVFSIRDLHVTSGISEVDAKSYLQYLVKAGYVAFRVKGAGGKPSTYRLVEAAWRGPLPPQVTRIKVVYDPNIREVTWPRAD
ncbi:hypothetical protein, partial [Zavarzinia aquatilis]